MTALQGKYMQPESPIRVFIFDDDEGYASECADALDLLGYEAHAGDVRQAFKMQVERFHPRFIILDLHMPEFDGMEALLSLREHADKDIGIVFVSAAHKKLLEAAEKMAIAHALPLLGILPKPLMIRELVRIFETHMPGTSAPH